MIDTTNMGIMANFVQPSSSNISTQAISLVDSDEDSSSNIDLSQDLFSALDSDSSELLSSSELATAVETAMAESGDEMPSNEEFQNILSTFGFDVASQLDSSEETSSYEDTVSSILSDYDADNLTEEDAQSIVAAFQDAGIEASDELVDAMADAGFDAQEVGTLAGVGAQGTPPPPPSDSSSSSEDYDDLDTNEDGVVSFEELQAAYGSDDETTSSSLDEQNALDNLSTLMDVLKSSSENEEASVDESSFDSLLKTINNQNNNSQINTYLQNSNTSSSLFSYA